MFTNYTNCLPAWSVGPNCYEKVYGVVAKFGKSAAVIGGKTALSKAYGPLQEALAGTDFKLSEPVWYGGNSTYENAAMLESQPAVQEADVIFAVGGGRAVDTCKAVAEHLGKPLFTFPTTAARAPSSTITSCSISARGALLLMTRPPFRCGPTTPPVAWCRQH